MTQEIIVEDCMDYLDRINENSIDSIITDPPYGLSFMGKNWDKALPDKEIWEQCLRVLKPGSFAFILCTPRQDCLSRMIINLEDAGFETNFTSIYWTYGSGFPKAMNISKAVDKRLGAERISLGPHPNARKTSGNIQICKKDGDGQLRPIPATPQAKALDGSYAGFQPKPAVEPIIVVMKPLKERTYVDQALSNQKGITWLDECRIPIDESIDDPRLGGKGTWTTTKEQNIYGGGDGIPRGTIASNPNGRFPANLLCCDDVLDDGKDYNRGGSIPNLLERKNNVYGDAPNRGIWNAYGDSGSFSRYFSLDAWWNEKVKNLPDEVKKTFPFLIVPKPTGEEKNRGLQGFDEGVVQCLHGNADGTLNKRTRGKPSIQRNIHPTVKPLALMSYLITLGSREGDVVLDPFCGSGTTLLACRLLMRRGIGIEISPEYAKIAKARITHVPPTLESFFQTTCANGVDGIR